MARSSSSQNSFSGGEFSPVVYGRQDIDKYKSGMATCLNAVPMSQGPWTRRPGTEVIHEVHTRTKKSRLFRFEYSLSQSYILEFGDSVVRFYTESAPATGSGVPITGISKASQGYVTSPEHSYPNGTRLRLSIPSGMTQLDKREVIVAGSVPGGGYYINDTDGSIDTRNYDTFTTGTSYQIIQVNTPYTEAMLPQLQVVPIGDVLYLLHPEVIPRKLTRTTAVTFSLSLLNLEDGPYLTTNATSTTLTSSVGGVGATGTLTASSTAGINDGVGFSLPLDLNRLVRIRTGASPGSWGCVRIDSVTSSVIANITVMTAVGTVASAIWRMGLYSDGRYPAAATFHEDRLVLAGAARAPNRIDASKSGLYASFEPSAVDGTVAADNAIAHTLSSKDSNTIRWMESDEKGLLAGTAQGEWIVRPSSQLEALTPSNVTSKPATHIGSHEGLLARVGSALMFVQRGGRKVRELAYVFEKDGFRAPDMTLLSEHITGSGIVSVAYQSQPQEILWAARADGVLLGFTYERDQGVLAWHRHELGGASDANGLLVPVVESLSVMPSDDGTRDELWMIVRRWVNGKSVRYIERMTKLWSHGDVHDDALFMDCGVRYSGTAITTMPVDFRLEGQTVTILADGAAHPSRTVTNGKITLDRAASKISVGLAYPSDGKPLPHVGAAQDGAPQGKLRRIVRVGFQLLDTLGFQYGTSPDDLTEIVSAEYGDDFGAKPELLTGVFRGSLANSSDREGYVFWRCSGPFPATLLSLTVQSDVADDS